MLWFCSSVFMVFVSRVEKWFDSGVMMSMCGCSVLMFFMKCRSLLKGRFSVIFLWIGMI